MSLDTIKFWKINALEEKSKNIPNALQTFEVSYLPN